MQLFVCDICIKLIGFIGYGKVIKLISYVGSSRLNEVTNSVRGIPLSANLILQGGVQAKKSSNKQVVFQLPTIRILSSLL